MSNQLTQQQIDDMEDTITRRMENTGESREEAVSHIVSFLESIIDSKR